MSIRDQHIKQLKEQLTGVLNDMVIKEEGIPRPIINLEGDMPFNLPVKQSAIKKLHKIAFDWKDEFKPAKLLFIVNPNMDPRAKRMTEVPYPYKLLSKGKTLDNAPDGSPVKKTEIVMKEVPENWRSERPLDLNIQARSEHQRYGEAIAEADTINLRVPRMAIPGKETGV